LSGTAALDRTILHQQLSHYVPKMNFRYRLLIRMKNEQAWRPIIALFGS
jgi:hypothetical protein